AGAHPPAGLGSGGGDLFHTPAFHLCVSSRTGDVLHAAGPAGVRAPAAGCGDLVVSACQNDAIAPNSGTLGRRRGLPRGRAKRVPIYISGNPAAFAKWRKSRSRV